MSCLNDFMNTLATLCLSKQELRNECGSSRFLSLLPFFLFKNTCSFLPPEIHCSCSVNIWAWMLIFFSDRISWFLFHSTTLTPPGIKVVELSAFEKYNSCFVTVAPPWRIFSLLWKCCPRQRQYSKIAFHMREGRKVGATPVNYS